MSARISRSVLDPIFMPIVPRLYSLLKLPKKLWPEASVLTGHLIAAAGAIALAFSTQYWWCGVLAALAIAGNHAADMIDGTHARKTGQCRNGGELLDHFLDPLSFSYWLIGLSASVGRIELGLVLVLILYATALLTSIKAKITGNFVLSRFGPTEFKGLLATYGGIMAVVLGVFGSTTAGIVATSTLFVLFGIGIAQLARNLVKGVREVNGCGAAPDTTPWQLH
jgi:phosphatidylglycerophosphate synthase